jgi:hypothetical protein
MNNVKVICPSTLHEDKWEKRSVAELISDLRTILRASG